MPLYELTDNALSPLKATSFQNENLWERRDLQRLLKLNIDVIASDLLVIAEEFGEWRESGRRIDLLAIDKGANLVVIELKRTVDGGHMELQAIRYAAMVANMTWSQAEASFKKYIADNDLGFDAEEKLCEFLGWDSPHEDDFAQNVRIILASADFSKEITTSVLWLNEHDLDINCVRLSLHKIDQKLVLSADQIIPLPEAESYQIEVRQKRREVQLSRNTNRDHSLFSIAYNGEVFQEHFKKSDIGFMTIRLLEQKGLINSETLDFLRNDTSCSFKLLKLREEITENEILYSRYRHTKEPVLMYEGEGYYVARNWGINNIPRLISKIEKKFPDIVYSSDAVRK